MPDQTPAPIQPAAASRWGQLLDAAYALAPDDKHDAIGDVVCEAYSLGVAAGVQRQDATNALTADLRRLRAELATVTEQRNAAHTVIERLRNELLDATAPSRARDDHAAGYAEAVALDDCGHRVGPVAGCTGWRCTR